MALVIFVNLQMPNETISYRTESFPYNHRIIGNLGSLSSTRHGVPVQDTVIIVSFYYLVSQEGVLRLINNRTKAFCSIFVHFVLDRLEPNLNFDISVFKIRQKLTGLQYREDKNAGSCETREIIQF